MQRADLLWGSDLSPSTSKPPVEEAGMLAVDLRLKRHMAQTCPFFMP